MLATSGDRNSSRSPAYCSCLRPLDQRPYVLELVGVARLSDAQPGHVEEVVDTRLVCWACADDARVGRGVGHVLLPRWAGRLIVRIRQVEPPATPARATVTAAASPQSVAA